MPMDSRVKDFFDKDSDRDFSDVLNYADSNSKTEMEMNFVSQIKEKYDKYGDDMFLSIKQKDWLEKLAERE